MTCTIAPRPDEAKMFLRKAVMAVAVLILSLLVAGGYSMQWPVPYQRYDSRPPSDLFCKALYPFCPTGYSDGHIPVMDDDDTLEVFILKAPVWEFKFGKLLDYFHIIHDAVGFRSMKTGLNYTNEWYELFQFFNCTFPHVMMKNWTSPLWCNQGAACFYPGIDDHHWKQNGTLQKVAEMTGAQFNKLAEYIKWDNHTGLFYDTWRVRNSTGSDYAEWFSPHECANYVIRLFQEMNSLGANFTSYKVNYTYLSLYSDMPILLGNESSIFGPNGNKTLATKMLEFYSYFQAHQPLLHFVESLVHIYDYIVLQKEYYFYFNSQYWFLPMKKPYMRISYEYVPFAP